MGEQVKSLSARRLTIIEAIQEIRLQLRSQNQIEKYQLNFIDELLLASLNDDSSQLLIFLGLQNIRGGQKRADSNRLIYGRLILSYEKQYPTNEEILLNPSLKAGKPIGIMAAIDRVRKEILLDDVENIDEVGLSNSSMQEWRSEVIKNKERHQKV